MGSNHDELVLVFKGLWHENGLLGGVAFYIVLEIFTSGLRLSSA
jgi:hypothetical protein